MPDDKSSFLRATQRSDGSLMVGPLRAEDSGIYTCTAASLQQLEQRQLQLRVQGDPRSGTSARSPASSNPPPLCFYPQQTWRSPRRPITSRFPRAAGRCCPAWCPETTSTSAGPGEACEEQVEACPRGGRSITFLNLQETEPLTFGGSRRKSTFVTRKKNFLGTRRNRRKKFILILFVF